MSLNDHLPKTPENFFQFKLAHLLQIVIMAGFVFVWANARIAIDTQQTSMIESHERRMQLLETSQAQMNPDIREIKTKVNILADLIDGDRKRPELHDGHK